MDNIRNELVKFRNEVLNILKMDYDQRGAFIPSILGRIDGILDSPKRNCDIGTAEEQSARYHSYCLEHGTSTRCDNCPLYGMMGRCEFIWAQMPYDEVK